ncbi:MAG: DNA excision repair protein ERCC-6 [Paramarteilia canceri]
MGIDWNYIILDEGHIIKNNFSKISQLVKEFKITRRIVCTGTPAQNNLTELWSLFDFTNPGLLGKLEDFEDNFSHPIVRGTVTTCTKYELMCAYSAACTLRNIIKPFIMRRTKAQLSDVIFLPGKSENVLYVIPTEDQIKLYKDYVNSKDVSMIFDKRLNVIF